MCVCVFNLKAGRKQICYRFELRDGKRNRLLLRNRMERYGEYEKSMKPKKGESNSKFFSIKDMMRYRRNNTEVECESLQVPTTQVFSFNLVKSFILDHTVIV